MRTTVEIPDRLRAALHATAARRGLRGFSKLVEEALDLYFQTLSGRDEAVAEVLALGGAWDDADAGVARNGLAELRNAWRVGEQS